MLLRLLISVVSRQIITPRGRKRAKILCFFVLVSTVFLYILDHRIFYMNPRDAEIRNGIYSQ
jgi:hypothetical protein